MQGSSEVKGTYFRSDIVIDVLEWLCPAFKKEVQAVYENYVVEQNAHRQAVKFAEDYHSGMTIEDVMRHEGREVQEEPSEDEEQPPEETKTANEQPEDEEEANGIREKIIRDQQTVSDRLKEIKALKDKMFMQRKTQKMLVDRQKLIDEEAKLEQRQEELKE